MTLLGSLDTDLQSTSWVIYICNGVEWSKDKTQAAESIKWRPQQAEAAISFYLFSRRQFSAHPQNHDDELMLNVLRCHETY